MLGQAFRAAARQRGEMHMTVVRANGERIPLGRMDGWRGYVNRQWWAFRWRVFREWWAGRRQTWR